MGRLRRKPVAESRLGDGVWQVPARFNFTRDVVEELAADALRPALTFVDREGVIDRRTFKTVATDASRWSALLRSRGLVPGDRLLVYVGRTPVWHSILLGALKAGLVAVPCPDTLTAADAALRAAHAGARLVVADDARAQKLASSDKGLAVDVVVVEEVADELREHSAEQPTEDTAAGDTAFILYTSGTTNEPRGAVHTHGYTWAQRLQASSWLDARPGDLVLCTAGIGTAESIWNTLLGPWSCGAEMAMHEADFDVEQRFDLIERIRVSVLCQVPSEYRLMAKHPSLEGFYIGSIRHAVSTGEPLDRAVAAIFHAAFGLTIYDGYGQTENTILVANPPGVPIRPGSMGLPTLGHEVAVVDDEGNEQAVGKEGDIALRGRPPSLFREYWDAPDETRGAFRGDWYITGDRATRDEDGYLWFTGRVGDAILSAAHRINPFEIESALLEHPSVVECLVIGRPVAGRGNLVKALVILRAGVEPSDGLVIELQDHVEEVTAAFKVPREIEFVAELPKTASGKIRRVAFREQEAGRGAGTDDTVDMLTEAAGTEEGRSSEVRNGPESTLVEETEARRQAAEDAALEEARRRKQARSAEVAAAAAVEAAARAERRIDLERRTAAALAAEQAAREEEARQALAVEQARLAAERAEADQARSRLENEERAAEIHAPVKPKAEPEPQPLQPTTVPTEAATEQSARAAEREAERSRKGDEQRRQETEDAATEKRKREKTEKRRAATERGAEAERQRKEEKEAAQLARREEADARRAAETKAKEDERQRKEDAKRQREEEKAAAELARREEADARRAAETKAKEDERQRKEDAKRQREEEKAAAELARREEADARRAAETQAKEDERQRKEQAKRQGEEEKAAAELARREEADARRAAEAKAKEDRDALAAEQRAVQEALRQEAKGKSSAPPTPEPDDEADDDENRPNSSLLARLSDYGHGKPTDGRDTPAE